MYDWSPIFQEALPYDTFLERYATPAQRSRWEAVHARIQLTDDQKTLLAGFKRRMPVLCLAGAWCGDCANQCPAFERIAAASNGAIELRFLDRDARPDARDALAICGGNRVPTVLFLNEDRLEVGRYGDNTLSGYRRKALEYLGASCPTGIVPPDGPALESTLADWIDEFERAQLILRLSPSLRARHND